MTVTSTGAAALLVLTGACASTPRLAEAPPPPLDVRFFNTSDQCPHPATVSLDVQGAEPASVAPGQSHVISLTRGEHAVALRTVTTDDQVTTGTTRWTVPDASGEPYLGCAAPEFLAAASDRVSTRLTYHEGGCMPGISGRVQLSLEGRAVATLWPGQAVTRHLPRGRHRLEVVRRDGTTTSEHIEVGSSPSEFALGCPARRYSHADALPLTVMGPALNCVPQASLSLRAGGVSMRLARGDALTVFVPEGTHLITVADGDAQGASRTVRVDVGLEGAVVRPTRCEASAQLHLGPSPRPANAGEARETARRRL